MPPRLTDEEFRQFSDWIAERYGLRFEPAKREILRARLEPRRAEHGFPTFQELLFHLKFNPDRDQEANKLIPLLTNNESYFFREKRQLAAFEEEILPALRKRNRVREKPVRILSGGCAGGEEAYTLGIIAQRTGALRPPAPAEVIGMDLDPQALERARAAVYTDHAFRGVPDEVKPRYFEEEDGGDRWKVKTSIRERVSFFEGNLVDAAWPRRVPPLDVVFCRNVLIYFDQETSARAVENIFTALAPGGYLFLGHAETLRRIPDNPFDVVRRPGSVFYQKPED